MFCPRCGKAHPENVQICTQCGETIVNRAAQVYSEYDATVMASPYDSAAYQPPVQAESHAPVYDDYEKTMAARNQADYNGYQQAYYPAQQEYQPVNYNQTYENNIDPVSDYAAGGYYPQANPYEEEKKKKSVSSAGIIIAVCSVALVILIAAASAVIYNRYGGFEDFIASFSDSEHDVDKDDEDEDVTVPEATNHIQSNVQVPAHPSVTVAPPTTEAQRRADGNCGTNLQFTFSTSTGELVIFGSGEMFDYSDIEAPWKSKNVRRVIIEEGVTTVSEGAFVSQSIDYIYVPSTVGDFSIYAIDYFARIEVAVGNAYYMSKDGALFNKDGSVLLCYPNESTGTSYSIPYGVVWIGPYAFFNADNLTNVIIPPSVQYIDSYAFKGCENIRNLTVPATVLEIESGVFSGWSSSQSIHFESGEVLVSDDWDAECQADISIAD